MGDTPSIQALVQQAQAAGVDTSDPRQMQPILDAYKAALRERPPEDGGLPPSRVDVEMGAPTITSRDSGNGVTGEPISKEEFYGQLRAFLAAQPDHAAWLQGIRDAPAREAAATAAGDEDVAAPPPAAPEAPPSRAALDRLAERYRMPPQAAAPPPTAPAPGGGPVTGPVTSTVLGGATPQGPRAAAPPSVAPRPGGRMGEMDAGYRAQAEGLRQAAEVGQQRAVEEASAKDEAYKQAVALAAKQQAAENERQRYRQEQLGKLEQATAHFQQLATRGIDPSRWYANQDTGQKILAGLGIFLGGFGANGGANQALGIVNNAIERDIAAQKSQIEGAASAVDAQRNLLGVMRQNFSDDVAAEAATRKTMLELAAQRLDTMAAKYDAPDVKAKAQMAAGQLREEAAKAGMQFSNQIEETAIKRMDAVTKRMAVLEKPGLMGRPMEGSAANRIGQADSALQALDVINREWGDKAHDWKAGAAQYLPATDASRYATKTKAVAQLVGLYLEHGVLRETDYQRYLGLMPTAGDNEKTKNEKISTLKELISQARDADLNSAQSAGFNTSGFKRVPMDATDLGGKQVR